MCFSGLVILVYFSGHGGFLVSFSGNLQDKPTAGQGCHKAASCTILYNIYTVFTMYVVQPCTILYNYAYRERGRRGVAGQTAAAQAEAHRQGAGRHLRRLGRMPGPAAAGGAAGGDGAAALQDEECSAEE